MLEELVGTNQPFSFERLQRLAKIERWHFWFVGRRLLIETLLERYFAPGLCQVLDLGCGTGYFLTVLSQRGYRPIGADLRPEGLRLIANSPSSVPVLQSESAPLPFVDSSFDGAVLLDLLEHTDDALTLSEIHRVLKPDGIIIATVPTAPQLWSYRDKDAGHLRRYTLQQTKSLFVNAQLQVLEWRFYQFFLFPLVVISRWLGHSGPTMRDAEESPPPALNSFFTWINTIEVTLSDVVAWPWGSSLTVVAKKTSSEQVV